MNRSNGRKRSGKQRVLKPILWSLTLAAILGAGGLYVILWAPNAFDGERVITVSKGDSFRAIEDTLVTAGVVRNKLLFNLAARILGSTRRMQIGRYRFRSGLSNSKILEDLEFGQSVELVTITIPEGTRARRVAAIYGRNLGLDTTLLMGLIRSPDFARRCGIDAPTLEGYLLPSTYRFYWQEAEESVLTAMTDEFRRLAGDSLGEIAAGEGMSLHEAVTLASIIEAETRIDSERAMISGVYHNRLRRRMRLQADPTVQYIIEDGPRRLTYADLQRSSPYNTYRNAGLPPGPINNPGIASILAALTPDKHGYFFFVANGGGGHTFSATYKEHLRQVRKFQKKRAEAARAEAARAEAARVEAAKAETAKAEAARRAALRDSTPLAPADSASSSPDTGAAKNGGAGGR